MHMFLQYKLVKKNPPKMSPYQVGNMLDVTLFFFFHFYNLCKLKLSFFFHY